MFKLKKDIIVKNQGVVIKINEVRLMVIFKTFTPLFTPKGKIYTSHTI